MNRHGAFFIMVAFVGLAMIGCPTVNVYCASTPDREVASTPTQPLAGGEPKAEEGWRDPETGMEFVFVKGGCYEMGCGHWTSDCWDDEDPVHEVCVNDFYMGKYEVTVGQFRKFVSDTGTRTEAEKGNGCFTWNGSEWKEDSTKNWIDPGFSQNDDHPVVCVSYNDAVEFTKWMQTQTRKTIRLPTEAEWEYAARSGGKGYKYSWGNGNPSGNVADESAKRQFPQWSVWRGYDDGYVSSAPVGRFAPNDLRLYDMSGNAWEWCQDWYDEDYYGRSPKINPTGSNSAEYRALRGGSWSSEPGDVRISHRSKGEPTDRATNLGFRLVLFVWVAI